MTIEFNPFTGSFTPFSNLITRKCRDGTNRYEQVWNSPPIALNGISGDGISTVVATFAPLEIPPYCPGMTVHITGVSPTSYNRTYITRSSTVNSVTLESDATGTYTGGGLISKSFIATKTMVTNLFSDSDSALEEWWVDGVRKAKLDASGQLIFGPDNAGGRLYRVTNHVFGIRLGEENPVVTVGAAGIPNLTIYAGEFGFLGLAPEGSGGYDSADVRLFRDGPGVFSQKRLGQPQGYKINNFCYQCVDYERFALDWTSSANVFRMGIEIGGAGVLRPLDFHMDGDSWLTVNTSGVPRFYKNVQIDGTTLSLNMVSLLNTAPDILRTDALQFQLGGATGVGSTLVMKSPDGTSYSLAVDNNGVLNVSTT
jgi:hypothetical protein